MKDQLKAYIEKVFSGAPKTQKNEELKEEILCNLYEKYDTAISEGMNEEEAYRSTVSSVGDLSGLFDKGSDKTADPKASTPLVHLYSEDERRKKKLIYDIGLPCSIMLYIFSIFPVILWESSVWAVVAMFSIIALATGNIIYIMNDTKPIMVSAEFNEEKRTDIKKKRTVSSVILAISIMLYITCVCPVILLTEYEKLGIMLMFTMIAIATAAIIIRANTLTLLHITGRSVDIAPKEVEKALPEKKTVSQIVFSVLSGIYWAIVCIVYFVVSFTTFKWEITWLIFVCGALAYAIVHGVFSLVIGKHRVGSIIKIVICSILLFALLSPTLISFNDKTSISFGGTAFSYDDSEYTAGGFSLPENSVVKELSIDWIAGNVTVEYWDENYISVSETSNLPRTDSLYYRYTGASLDIKFQGSRFRIPNDVAGKDLTVKLPKNTRLDELYVTNISGNTVINSGIYNEVDFDTVSGDVTWSGETKIIDVDTVSGKIDLTFEKDPYSISIDGVSGSAYLTMPKETQGFYVEFDSLSGIVIWDTSVISSDLVGHHYKNGSTDIEFDSVSGNLNIAIAQ